MSDTQEVGVIYVGVVEVECPVCEKRTRLDSTVARGTELVCSECATLIYISDDADYEIDDNLSALVSG